MINSASTKAIPVHPEAQQESAKSNGRFGNKKVNTAKGTATSLSKKESTLKKVVIILRAVKQCPVLVYYFIRFKLSGSTIADHNSKYRLNELAPVLNSLLIANKSLQGYDKETLDSKPSPTNITLSPSIRYEISNQEKKIIESDFLNNIKKDAIGKLSIEEAQTILNKHFNDKYTVTNIISTNFLTSCFEVTAKDGKKHIAKVLTPEIHEKLKVEIESCKLLLPILFNKNSSAVSSALNALQHECDLISEHSKLNTFSTALLATKTNIQFDFEDEQEQFHQFNLTFSTPKISEDKKTAELLITEKPEGYSLSELRSTGKLHNKELEKCFTKNSEPYLKAANLMSNQNKLLNEVKNQINAKWHEIMLNKHRVHADLNDDNIFISFGDNKTINVSICDAGNSFEIKDDQTQCLKSIANAMYSYYTSVPDEVITHHRDIVVKQGNKLSIAPSRSKKILNNLMPTEEKIITEITDLLSKHVFAEKLSSKEKESCYRFLFYTLSTTYEDAKQKFETNYPIGDFPRFSNREEHLYDLLRGKISESLIQVISTGEHINKPIPGWIDDLKYSLARGGIKIKADCLI